MNNPVSDFLLKDIHDRIGGREVWIYGTGAAADSFLELSETKPTKFIETSPRKSDHRGLPVVGKEALREAYSDSVIILICSMYALEISETIKIESRGLADYVVPGMVASNRIIVYVKNLADHRTFVNFLNREVCYAKLRWFEHFVVKNDDWDLLVSTGDLDKVLSHPLLQKEPTEFAFDFKWDRPLGYVDESLYYPIEISDLILKNRFLDERGFYRVCPKLYRDVFIYHVVFQKKQEQTLLPLSNNANTDKPIPGKFFDELSKLGLLDPNMADLYEHLFTDDSTLPPPSLSHARRWADVNESEFLCDRLKKTNPEISLCVFVLRGESVRTPLGELLISTATEHGLIFLGEIVLTEDERAQIASTVRGGCWGETPASSRAGLPSSLVLFQDRVSSERVSEEVSDNPFEIGLWRTIKEEARREAMSLGLERAYNNWLHSTDDHRESLEALMCIQQDRWQHLISHFARLPTDQ